jgi:hypothetical protein
MHLFDESSGPQLLPGLPPRPSYILSITGDAKDPVHTKDAPALITRCVQQFALHGVLYDILNTSKSMVQEKFWVVTGGTNQGIMGQCGKRFRQLQESKLFESSKSHVHLLGIAPTGPVGLTAAPLNPDELSFEGGAPACLDSNHDFLVLFDNGHHSRHFGTEIQFRRAFELHAARRTTGNNASVICIVFGGGKGTLDTVMSCTRDKIPVLLINGSSRAAELLSEARMCAKRRDLCSVDRHILKLTKFCLQFF